MTPFIPSSPEVETAVLGIAMTFPETVPDIVELPPELFYSGRNRKVLEAIKRLSMIDVEPDILSVARELGDGKSNWNAGIMEIADQEALLCNPKMLPRYIQVLRETARQRNIVLVTRTLHETASKRLLTTEELFELEEQFQQAAYQSVLSNHKKTGPVHVQDIMHKTISRLDAQYNRKIPAFGLSTGFKSLDNCTTGLHPAEVWIVAGRPGMGKTALALNIALPASKEVTVLVFEHEMSDLQVGQRLLASKCAVDLRGLRCGRIQSHEFNKIIEQAGDIADRKLFVDETSTLTAQQIRARARQIATKQGELGLIVVDHIGLVTAADRKISREQQISGISREFKYIAKDLNVPVVILSQLNREVEKRADKRPTLADLRESGAIEQDADVVLGLYRDYVYSGAEEKKGQAELLILKQRNGPIGTLDLEWIPDTATYWEPDTAKPERF